MGKHLDIGYFKKKIKVRSKVAKKRTVINKYNAWQLEKKYYDGNRLDGYVLDGHKEELRRLLDESSKLK